jgi:nucleoside-diphosphate-sugar epimerase
VAERTRRCGRRRDDLGRIRQDVVYHLAGYVSGSRELDAVLPSLRNNPVSAVNVLVAAARIGCIITSLLRAERPKLSSGTRPVDWVYVDDVVDAFIAASARDDLAGASLDIGTGELVTIRAIVEQIVETVGQESSRLGSAPGAPTRDSSRRRRRTDEGPSRLGAPNSPHRGVAVHRRLVPSRARARRTICPSPQPVNSPSGQSPEVSSRGSPGLTRSAANL